MKEFRFWWAFSCWSLNSLMPQWCWLIQIEERNLLIISNWREEFLASSPMSSSTSHLENMILRIFLATYFEISMLFSNEEKSKIPSSILHHVFSMLFSTIVECFPTIKFWLLCMKENIKLCIWLRKCWNFRMMGMKYCWRMASTKNIT